MLWGTEWLSHSISVLSTLWPSYSVEAHPTISTYGKCLHGSMGGVLKGEGEGEKRREERGGRERESWWGGGRRGEEGNTPCFCDRKCFKDVVLSFLCVG